MPSLPRSDPPGTTSPPLSPVVDVGSAFFAGVPTAELAAFRRTFLEAMRRPGCPADEREALADMAREADAELAARLAAFVEDDQAAPSAGEALVDVAEGYGIVRGAATPTLPTSPRRHANVCPDLGLRPVRGGGRGRR